MQREKVSIYETRVKIRNLELIYIGQHIVSPPDYMMYGYTGSGSIYKAIIDNSTFLESITTNTKQLKLVNSENADEVEQSYIEQYADKYGKHCININHNIHYDEAFCTAIVDKIKELNNRKLMEFVTDVASRYETDISTAIKNEFSNKPTLVSHKHNSNKQYNLYLWLYLKRHIKNLLNDLKGMKQEFKHEVISHTIYNAFADNNIEVDIDLSSLNSRPKYDDLWNKIETGIQRFCLDGQLITLIKYVQRFYRVRYDDYIGQDFSYIDESDYTTDKLINLMMICIHQNNSSEHALIERFVYGLSGGDMDGCRIKADAAMKQFLDITRSELHIDDMYEYSA